jgi:hypothetical protein
MKAHTRRAIVYIAARLTGSRSNSVYDVAAIRHFLFSGSADAQRCQLFDHDEHCYISGSFPGLYHHGNRQHVTLRMRGRAAFSGFDYDSQSQYTGSFHGPTAIVYDYEDAKYHMYST